MALSNTEKHCFAPCPLHVVQAGQCTCRNNISIASGSQPFKQYNTQVYSMCKPQQVQLDCRNTTCRYYVGAGHCINDAPAITLNANKTFVCWSKEEIK